MTNPGCNQPEPVTELLARLGDDPAASERLMPIVYDELRHLAAAFMRQERRDHTLQTTALVNEAYVRLFGSAEGGGDIDFRNRSHFMAIAAKVMRRVLVDHARAANAAKRGGEALRVTLSETAVGGGEADGGGVSGDDLLSVSDALAKLHPRMARVVELRFFGGLTIDQASAALGVATSTIEADWSFARAWLKRELSGGAGGVGGNQGKGAGGGKGGKG